MQKVLFALLILVSFGLQGLTQNPFGDGSDGSLVVGINDTVYTDNIKTEVTECSLGDNEVLVDDAALFYQGDEVLIITMTDPEQDSLSNTTGNYEFHRIYTIFDNVIVLNENLTKDHACGSDGVTQIIKIPNYTDVTVNGLLTCHPWNGLSGGVLAFRSNGNMIVSIDGTVDVSGLGYQARDRQGDNGNGRQGEGLYGIGGTSTSNYGNAGGGGIHAYGAGGGGGHAFSGGNGNGTSTNGIGGEAVGDSILSRIYFGGSGGTGGDNDGNAAPNPNSGAGGGIIFMTGNQLNNYGIIKSNGTNAVNGGGGNDGGSGGGAGGSVYLGFHTIQNDSMILAEGGNGYANSYPGGNGSVGRILFDNQVLTNTGTVTPGAISQSLYGIFHIPLVNTSNTSGPYNISAQIIDEQGNTITSASLKYKVNGGSFNSLALSASGFTYTGGIPGQTANSTIEYYIEATDGSDTYMYPDGAPTNLVSFNIGGLPPSNFTLSDDNAGNITLNWNEPMDPTGLVDYKVYRSQIPGFIPGAGNLLASTSDTFYVDATVKDFYTYYYRIGANYSASIALTDTISVLVNNFNLTTVLGYAYLENQTNHANIKVKFNPISPSAVLDSTYTDALGYFETTVVPGIYDVTYEKVNYQTYYRVESYSIIEDNDFGESTILSLGNANISGDVSGVWDGLYTINGNITIPNGDSLTIMAGSEIRFLGNYHIYVYGYLNIAGEEGDSVLITSAPHNQIFAAGQWQGIDFYNSADDNSLVEYVIIRYAAVGFYCEDAQPTLQNSLIHSCSSQGYYITGDGLTPHVTDVEIYSCDDGFYNYNANPVVNRLNSHNNARYGLYYNYSCYGSIKNSTFNENSSHGLYFYYSSSPSVDSCEVNYNNSWGIRTERSSSPHIYNSLIKGNSGYGVSFNYDGYDYTSQKLRNCVIEDNTSWGLFLRHYLTPDCKISDNLIQNNGGGIYLYYQIDCEIYNNRILANNSIGVYFDNNHYCDPYIHHNVIAYNAGDGIHRDNHTGTPTLTYNTIYGNDGDGFENNQTGGTTNFSGNIVSNNNGYGVNNNQSIATFEYNNIYSNASGHISSLSNLPVNGWDFVSFNSLNDSADIYLNISEDPMFLFAADSADLQLSMGSHCIDVGDPAALDPDGTAADLGALYFDKGYPHSVYVDGYANQSVSISWDEVESDSILSYNVYYKLNSASNYTMFGNAAGLSTEVTGLTNDSLYDFTVTGQYGVYESGYAPKVSERPGVPQIDLDPTAFNVTVLTDTVDQNLTVTNNGSRELSVILPQGMTPGAYHFDGNSDYLRANDPSQFENLTELTIETWIKRENDGHIEFISKYYRQWSVYINSANRLGLYKGYTSDWYQSITSSYVVPLNEWHHIAISWKGTSVKFYADGVLVDEVFDVMEYAIPNHGYYFMIGCRANDYNYYFQGSLAEVRIWNVQRSGSDIARYMYSDLEGTETGLVGYFPLKTDYADYSVNNVSFYAYGNMYFTGEQITDFDDIPYLLPNGENYLVPANGNVVIPFEIYPTGQSGTYLYTQKIHTNIEGNEWMDYEVAITYGETVPSTPVHFTSVDSTGQPYHIIITDAKIDDVTIAVGDEIGVYDNNLCVGAGIFDGSFNFVLTVWEEDAGQSLAGFVEGNDIEFVIYDASADLEATVEAEYIVGDGTFGFGEFTACSLTSTVYKIQEVPVAGNMFNLISFNKLPRYSNSEVVFGSLADMQIVYNDAGYAFIPPYNINTMGDIFFKDGYHIFTNSDDTIDYEGTFINPFNWPIAVEAGKWNSIAYLGESSEAPLSVIEATIVDSIDIIQTSSGGAWIPSLSVNTLGQFEPGLGYQVALSSSSDIDITYQTDNSGSAKLNHQIQEDPQYFKFNKTGLPYQIIVEMDNVIQLGLLYGDEIAVFDNDRCVGAAVYSGEERLVLTAWSEASKQNMKGFTEGNIMTFRIYNANGETVSSYEGFNGNNNYTFKGANYAHIRLINETLDNSIDCYPNPFSESTRITINLNSDTDLQIRVIDLTGKVIKNLANDQYQKGIYQFEWNGKNSSGNICAEGVYFLEIYDGDQVKTEKLIKL